MRLPPRIAPSVAHFFALLPPTIVNWGELAIILESDRSKKRDYEA